MSSSSLLAIVLLSVAVAAAQAYQCTTPPLQPGNLDIEWFAGQADCSQPAGDAIQVHAFDNATYILRQNKCINYEAPFIYLLFGTAKVLLFDTGATVDAKLFPLRDTVERIIATVLAQQGRARSDVLLVVAHSHSHGDHISGDSQFANQPYTVVVGHAVDDVTAFFHIEKWPESTAVYSLGARDLAVVPIPGHQEASIALYDCNTNVLFMGDTLYPGRLYVKQWTVNRDSIARLSKFVATSVTHVAHVLGAHVEMSSAPKMDYPTGETYQPQEHNLTLWLSHLTELNDALQSTDAPQYLPHNDFIIYPNPPVAPAAGGRRSVHGQVVFVPAHADEQLLVLSHLPEFSEPHDWQIITLVASSVDVRTLPTSLVTLDPEQMSLNDLISGHITSVGGDLYNGSSEQGGTKISSVSLSVKTVLQAEFLNNTFTPQLGFYNLRYLAFWPTTDAAARGRLDDVMLVHHIRNQENHGEIEFDQILRAELQSCHTTDGSAYVPTQGDEWLVRDRPNALSRRMRQGESETVLLLGDPLQTQCQLTIVQELSCLLAPGFYDNC